MSNKKILIIDDEAPLRRVIELTLKITAGWQVLTASSGREGIVKATTERPDAILLDVMMPDLDGAATLGQLRANNKTQNIPVILLTAKAQILNEKMFNRFDVASVIVKPFDPKVLVYQIAAALGWQL